MKPRTTTMNIDHLPLLALPTDLSDETAAQLLEFLYDIAHAIEDHYAGQLLRYYHRPDDRQSELWDERDPPF